MKFLNHNLFTGDITVNGTTTLSTATGVTRATGDNTTHLATTAFVKAQDYATNTALGNYVPVSRTLTINGVTLDLSANRSWTIATSDYTSTLKHTVKAGVAITKGQAVYVTSADGTNMIVGLASNATEATSSKTMGLVDTTVAVNGFTSVITEGLLAGLNTSAAETAGEPVWLGVNGNLIFGLANKPYAPAHLVFIGIVTRVSVNNGEIFVKVQNGFELKEIHDVDLITVVPVNGEILGFNGTLWVNKTIAGWLGYTPANASGTTNYVSKFTGSTTLGNSLIYDNGTGVGIGTTDITAGLHVNYSAANTLLLQRISDDSGPPEAIGRKARGTINAKTGVTANDRLWFFAAAGYIGTEGVDGAWSSNKVGMNFVASENWTSAAQGTHITWATTEIGQTTRTDKMILTGAGNLGIGTTSPYSPFQVGAYTASGGYARGSVATLAGAWSATLPTLALISTDNTSTQNKGGGIGFGSGSEAGSSPYIYAQIKGLKELTGATYSGYLAFYTTPSGSDANTERMRINSSGDVGIGTTSPARKLDVNGTSIFRDFTTVVSSNGNPVSNTTWLSSDSGITNIYTGGNSTVQLNSNGVSYFNGGNVGIGTSSPGATLDVNGNVYIRPSNGLFVDSIYGYATNLVSVGNSGNPTNFNVPAGNVGIGTTSPSYKLQVYNSSNGTTAAFGGTTYGIRIDNGGTFSSGRSTIYGVDSTFYGSYQPLGIGASEIYFNISGTDRVIINSSGNVGIGTTSPANKLQVANGDMSITSGYSFILADTDTNWRLGRNIISPVESVYLNSNTFEFVAANASDQGWQFINDDGYPVLEIGAATGSRNVWVNAGNLLVPTGSVGIGTSSPATKLDVNGVITATGGNSTNWNTAFSWGNHAGLYLGVNSKAADSELLDGIDSSRFVYGNSGTRRGTNLISNWNQNDYPDVAFLSAENGGTNAPSSDYSYGMQYSFHRSGAPYRTQFVTSLYSDLDIWVRNSRDADVWTSWKRLWHSGDFTSTNISNWNTAYGWGNHASQSYATQTYVNTAIANLVDSAPATLDTLNELAAALGDDPNFATTVATSIGTKQNQLNGTGFVKVSGTTVSYDNSTYYLASNPSGFISSYTETDTLATVTGRGASTSTNSVFTGGLQARKNQTDNNYSTAALWTESYGNTTTGIAFHISGNVGKFLEMRTNGILYWDNAQVWTAGTLTNLNQLTNGPGYITGYTETDTLNSVTGRGNTTSNSVRFGTHVDLSPTNSAFRFYDGSTFRGGLGLDDWAHSGSAANITAYVNGDNNFFISTSGVKRAQFNSGAAIFRTYSTDTAYNIRLTGGDQINAYYNDAVATLYLQYHNGNGGTLNVGNGKLTVNTAGSVVASGDMRAPIFYDSNDTNYYLDLSAATSSYAAGVFRQNDGKFVRDSHHRTFSGFSDYYPSGNAGWYRVAEITLTTNCAGAVLFGTLYDHRYDGADAYQVSIVARAECGFTSNNESHYINVGCTILGSTNHVDYKSKIRVVLSASSAGSRTYEVQFYETAWNQDTWQLETTGWTIYTTPQAPRAAVGTPNVYYVSNQNADYQRANTATYSPVYYDSDDTTYYADFNSTSGSAIKVRGGILTGPNPSWSQFLQLGGDGNNSSHATVAVTNGNLHIDAKNGSATYINHYYGNKIHLGSGGAGGGTYTHSNFSLAGNLNLGGGDGDASHRLQVIGNALVQGTQGFNAAGETASLYIGDTASEIRAVYDGGLDFYQNSVHRVRIESGTGNFGIGTTSPGTKLDVNGVITATGGNSTQWNTAYGWGNHASAGYITANQTITLSGVVTGSGTTAITTAIANGAITNAMLANSSFFVGTTSIALGRATAAQTLTGVSIDGNAATATSATSATSATQVVTLQDDPPAGVNGKLWWETDTGQLKVYYGASTAWVDALPMPDMTLYLSIAGGAISGDLSIAQTLTVTGNILSSAVITATGGNSTQWNTAYGWGNHAGLYLGVNSKAADSELLDGLDSTNFMRSYGMLNNTDVYVNFRVIQNNNSSSANDGLYIGYNNSNSGITRIFGGGATSGGLVVGGAGVNDVSIAGNTVWNSGNDGAGSGLDADLLDGNHASAFYLASNPSGYISSYTETDTLATVTGRGATTTTPIIVTASEGREVAVYMASSYTTDDLVSGHEYGWYADHWRLGMTRSGGAAGADFVIQWNGARRLSLTNGGNLTVTGTISATNFSGSSSGTNTGDQTNISGNAATATNAVAASNLSLTSLGTASVNVNNGSSAVYRNENGSGGNLNYAPVLHLGGGDTMWQIQGDYYDSSTLRWRAGYNGTWYAWRQIYHSGNFTDNSSNWNTAYGWGNHASAGYITGYTETDTLGTVTNRGNSTSQNLVFSNGRKGLVGVYDAAQTQAIFAMGAAYVLTDGGGSATMGDHYGLAWSYNPNYGGSGNNPQSKAGLEHQLLVMNAGITKTALGAGIWTSGLITTTSYGTSSDWNTAYGWGNHASADYIVKGTQVLSAAGWTTATKFGSVGDISQDAGNHALSVRSELNNDAFMSFHIGSDYAVHFGLDRVSNRMHVGGWSDGTGNKYQIWDSRDFSSTNISNWNTAYGWGNHASAGYQAASTAITTSNIGSQSVNYALNSTRLYASDAPYTFGGSAPYYMYMNYDGGSYWELKVSPATPGAVRVAYANSAGSASTASTAGYSDEAKWISYPDGPRDLSDRLPNWNNRSVAWDFVGAGTANGSGNYGGVMTFSPWDGTSASTGDSSYQLAFANATGVNASGQPKLSIRNGINSTWNAWYTLVHSGNVGDQSVSFATTAGALSSMNISQFTNNSGYITGNQTITLSGDVSGSGTTSIVVTVNDIDGWGFVNTGSNSPINADTINSNGISYYTAGVTNFSGNATDGALYSQRYSDSWQHQIAGDYRSGMIAVRGKNNGTWTAWKTIIDSSTIGSQSVSYATTAGSAPNAGNLNPYYNVSAGVGYGLRFWGGSDEYKISMGVGGLYQYGPVTDYSIKTQMDAGSTGRGFTWGNNGVTPVAALNATSGNMQIAGTFTASNFSGSSSGTNTGDQTNISGNAATATSATQVVTIQDDPPTGVNGKLWWESDTGKLKVYYGTSSAWVDATPVPDMSLYYAKAGGPISGDVTIQQTLTVVGNTLIQGTLTETSDISLKENILPLESSLDKVMKLNGVSFNKKATPNVKEIGFIAQEVEAVIPDLVTETNEGIKTVSYSRVTAVLVETIKEQQAQIEELKNMVNMLAEKLNNL